MAEEVKDGTVDESAEELQSTEDSTDWKAEARKWEKRAKENADKAKKFEEYEEANKSEFEKLTERNKKLEEELSGIKSREERNKLAQEISKDTGVPADLIVGTTEDEMREFAEKIKEYATPKSSAKVPKSSKFDTNGIQDAKRQLAQQLRNQN